MINNLRLFSIFYLVYSILAIISNFINLYIIVLFIPAFIASFFLRMYFKELAKNKQEFRIPYAGSYLMLLGYLGIIVGIPTSSISIVHLLGLTLVLVGALFVNVGILTALVLGVYNLSRYLKKKEIVYVSLIFLLGLIFSFIFHIVGNALYTLASIIILVEFP